MIQCTEKLDKKTCFPIQRKKLKLYVCLLAVVTQIKHMHIHSQSEKGEKRGEEGGRKGEGGLNISQEPSDVKHIPSVSTFLRF